MTPTTPRSETLELGNAALALQVRLPSGRLVLRDKQTGARWTMDGRDTASGRLSYHTENSAPRMCHFGRRGRQGVLFSRGELALRSGQLDDFESLTIQGEIQPQEESTEAPSRLTIDILVSRAFPTVDFNLTLEGPLCDRVDYIAYPLGFGLPGNRKQEMVLPLQSHIDREQTPAQLASSFSECHPGPGTAAHGVSIFSICQETESGRRSALVGYLLDPHFELQTHRDDDVISATPVLLNPKGALSDWKVPYHFRYAVLPDASDEAIAWMFQENNAI